MFDDEQLDGYLARYDNLPETADRYVRASWEKPSRMVGTHAKDNLVSFVPSRKLRGGTYSTESRSPERAFLTLCEFNDEVLVALDQPDPVQIHKTIKNGSKRWSSYTPDALILTPGGPRVVEVKAAETVAKLLKRYPDDWEGSDDNQVVFKPAYNAFAKLGIQHVVYVYSSADRYLIENLDLILLARHHAASVSLDENRVRSVLEDAFAVSLHELMKELDLTEVTPLVHAIDRGLLAADLKRHRIVDLENCLVSLNENLLEQAIELINEQQIYRDGLVQSEGIELVPTLAAAERALYRLEQVQSGISSRNVRRWKRLIELGQHSNLSDFQSLIPRQHLRGNRSRKLPTVVEECLMDFLMGTYIKAQGLSRYRGYKQYEARAQESHPQFRAVSFQTFLIKLKRIPGEIFGQARGGNRKANAMASPTSPEERHLKASVPWQLAAADHYLADIYLVLFSRTGEVYIERPWITALIDLATSKILGLSISFCAPSRRSVAKVFRDCVRQHGRLPREIVVDRGPDFKSVYLASLMAHYGLTLTLRPSASPRYGGEVEGFFGEFKKEWLCQRPGNLADRQEARSVDGKKAPKKAAILQPVDFYKELLAYRDWRENKCRGGNLVPIDSAFKVETETFPFYAEPVEYDSQFIAVTAVEDKKYALDPQRGINIKNTWYYSPPLRKLEGRVKRVDVRLDPENPNLVFARVGDKWEPCYSSGITEYSSKDVFSQLVLGMIKHEAAELRRKISRQHDLELAEKIRELDEFKKQTKSTPVWEIEWDEENGGQDLDIFAGNRSSVIRPISIQSWEN
jgi:transposase InsO family protein